MIFEWKPSEGVHNFGDALGPFILKKIIEKNIFNRIVEDQTLHVYPLGSCLDNNNFNISNSHKNILIGIGYRGYDVDRNIFTNSVISGCRGKDTRDFLMKYDVNTEVIGDPAELIPLIVPIFLKKKKSFLFVPHVKDKHWQAFITSEVEIVSARVGNEEELVKLIKKIANSAFVIAGAMHVAIIANAYNVPFCFYKSDSIDCKPKWLDYGTSIGLSHDDVLFFDSVGDGYAWYETIKSKLVRVRLHKILNSYGKNFKLSIKYRIIYTILKILKR